MGATPNAASQPPIMPTPVEALFDVHSGDFHSASDLDTGAIPLVSCGTTDNGFVGLFDIPEPQQYSRAITVAYNGAPLTATFHPYVFGAKDDVAVLIPHAPMQDASLLYIASVLNRMRWRYSYGRKCFRDKLRRLLLPVPVVTDQNGHMRLDEAAIIPLLPHGYRVYLPHSPRPAQPHLPALQWRSFGLANLFDLIRGDFHSLSDLDPGPVVTVSRITESNGVVGYYERPEGVRLYGRGHITITTRVTPRGFAFVQLDEFMLSDNVVVCLPKRPLRITTLFFITFMLNYQRWRYSYSRQCYLEKVGRVQIYLPVTSQRDLDEDAMEQVVTQASYWPQLQQRFTTNQTVEPQASGQPPLEAQQLTLPLE